MAINQSNSTILHYLHILLSNNVLGDKQYFSRYKGFVGELDFQQRIRQLNKAEYYFTGGYLVPKVKGSRSVEYPIYFTVSSEHPNRYREIYSKIQMLPCEKMYFIHWNRDVHLNDWLPACPKGFNADTVLIPEFTVYLFEHGSFQSTSMDEFTANYPLKNNRTLSRPIPYETQQQCIQMLSRFDFDLLLDLYVQRLIFDGFIGYSREHGIPSDIDAIFLDPRNNEFHLLEVKEKDLSKYPPRGFGMDVVRIEDLNHLCTMTGIPVSYIVKQVESQTTRKFLAWKCVSLNNFIKNAVESGVSGGSGMGLEKQFYKTMICPEEYFQTLP